MRAILQRVQHASVSVNQEVVGEISSGLLIFLGIEPSDQPKDQDWLLRKITQLKIFEGADGRMSENLLSTNGSLLIVSQFTLHASTKKGTRPSFHRSAPPAYAEECYLSFIEAARQILPSEQVQAGVFGADMQVSLLNDGPVTLILDSQNPE